MPEDMGDDFRLKRTIESIAVIITSLQEQEEKYPEKKELKLVVHSFGVLHQNLKQKNALESKRVQFFIAGPQAEKAIPDKDIANMIREFADLAGRDDVPSRLSSLLQLFAVAYDLNMVSIVARGLCAEVQKDINYLTVTVSKN